MKKQDKQMIFWIIGVLVLVLAIIGGTLFSVINWSSSGATMTNVQKVGNNIELSRSFVEVSNPTHSGGRINTWGATLSYYCAVYYPGKAYYNHTYALGSGYFWMKETTTWYWGGSYSNYQYVTYISCGNPNYQTSGNILYVAYQTIQDNNKFTLGNLTETLNGGTITYKLVFNGTEYDFTDNVLELEVPESSNIQLKAYLTGSTSATPQYADTLSLDAEYIAPAVLGGDTSLSTLEEIVFSTTGSKSASFSSNLSQNLTSPLAIFGYVVAVFVLLISFFAIRNKWS